MLFHSLYLHVFPVESLVNLKCDKSSPGAGIGVSVPAQAFPHLGPGVRCTFTQTALNSSRTGLEHCCIPVSWVKDPKAAPLETDIYVA